MELLDIFPIDIWQFCIIDYLGIDEQEKLIKLIDNLQITVLGANDLNDEQLLKFKHIKFLTVSSHTTNKGISHLDLYKLNLDFNEKITDDGISHMKNLQELNLSDNKQITDEGISHMNKLKRLYLCGSNITDRGIYDKDLTCLHTSKKITDEGISHMINMRVLYISSNHKNITDLGIKNMINMESLYIQGSNITDDGISRMKLKELDIAENNNITDEGISHILMDLQEIDISDNTCITDKSLKQMKNLHTLYAYGETSITQDCFSQLKTTIHVYRDLF